MEKNTKISIVKYAENFDEEFKPTDFTLEDLQKLNHSKSQKTKKFKEEYFDFYDDVKDSSRKKQDW